MFIILKYLLALKLLVISSLRFFEFGDVLCTGYSTVYLCVIISVYWTIERQNISIGTHWSSVSMVYKLYLFHLSMYIYIYIYIYIYTHTHTHIHIYTGCNRRNGPDFGRVFLMLNYTEKPQNTYIQSSMVTKI